MIVSWQRQALLAVLTAGQVAPIRQWLNSVQHPAAKMLLSPAHRRMEPTLALMLMNAPQEVGASQTPSKPSRSVWSCTSVCAGCPLKVQAAQEAMTQPMCGHPICCQHRSATCRCLPAMCGCYLQAQHGYSPMVMVGDGATDAEARQPGGADLFIG